MWNKVIELPHSLRALQAKGWPQMKLNDKISTQVPAGQLLGVTEAIIIDNKMTATWRLYISLSHRMEFPFYHCMNLKNSG